jgi:uncharacterized protein YggE
MAHQEATMSTRRTLPLVLLVAIGASTAVRAQTPAPAADEQPTVVATGDAIVKRAPDRAFVTIGVEAEDGRPGNAERKAAETMTKVQAAIGAHGIGGEAIRTTSFTVQPRYQFGGGRRYVARHVIEVRVDDLAKIDDVLDTAGDARAAMITGLRFDLEDRSGIELEALRLAVRDATDRAQALAAGSGRSVTAILRIQEHRQSSPSQFIAIAGEVPAMAGRGGGRGPSTPIEPGEIQIRAQVTLTASVR